MKFEGKGKRASIVSYCLVHNLKLGGLEAGNACRELNYNNWMTCQIVLMNATQIHFNSLFGAWRTGMSGATICIKRKCTFAYSAVIYFILLRRVKRGRNGDAWYGGGQSISLEKRKLFKELGKN